jgi:hypothetical protein
LNNNEDNNEQHSGAAEEIQLLKIIFKCDTVIHFPLCVYKYDDCQLLIQANEKEFLKKD